MKELIRSGHLEYALLVAVAAAAMIPAADGAEHDRQAVAVADTEVTVREALARYLPHTPIDVVDCGLDDWCEIVTGENVVYTDKAASRLFVGRVFDLASGRDLTTEARARRALDLRNGATRVDATAEPTNVDWGSLPPESAVIYNHGAKRKIAVFSDLGCPYCRLLHGELSKIPDLEVREYLVSLHGSRQEAQAVLCAEDRASAARAVYRGERLPPAENDCARGSLDRNNALFAEHAFQGTPVLVRDDGAVLLGARDRDALEEWIEGEKAK